MNTTVPSAGADSTAPDAPDAAHASALAAERDLSPSGEPAVQPCREQNIQAIVDFYLSGIIDPSAAGKLGIELEHTIVGEGGSAVSYYGQGGVAETLAELALSYPQTTYDDHGDLLGVARGNEAVTIEPAAQLELSAGPFASLLEARETFTAFEKALAKVLEPRGQRALTLGYHPTAAAIDLELIPKQRYRFMNEYLGAIGPFGPCMMRGSASTQVSIDYFSEEDCLRKMRVAFALVPLFSLLCDNSPWFEGKPRKHQLVRTEIWQHCDPKRCGVVPHIMDRSFTLADYAAYILDAPAILVPDGKGGWRYTEETFGQLYANEPMGRADVEHALSMFFTDVRLKTYVEIRPADALPIPYVMAYAALIKGLFYSQEVLRELDDLIENVDESAIDAAKGALMEDGYGATVYGKDAGAWCDTLIALARKGLADDEQAFLEPLALLVARRSTLACLTEDGNFA